LLLSSTHMYMRNTQPKNIRRWQVLEIKIPYL
jgi:hypothetical protein